MKGVPLPSTKSILNPRKRGQQTRSKHSDSSLPLRSGLKPAAERYSLDHDESGAAGSGVPSGIGVKE